MQVIDGSTGLPMVCSVCGEPATGLFNTNTSVTSGILPSLAMASYCDEHNPLPNIHTAERGIGKAAFKQFLDRLYYRIPLRLDQIELALDDDTDPLIDEWFYEWAQE